MAESDGITVFQSFSERTLKYGRNMMAVAVAVIVFAWVPAIDLTNSRPLNFVIVSGQEHWVWVLFLCALIYYAVRFFGLAKPDYANWFDKHHTVRESFIVTKLGIEQRVDTLEERLDDLVKTGTNLLGTAVEKNNEKIGALHMDIEGRKGDIKRLVRERRDYRWRRNYFWLTDALLPTGFFIVAVGSVIYRLLSLAPLVTNCPHDGSGFLLC